MTEMTLEQWQAQARALFGDDAMAWKFACPSCGHVATVADWKAAGAPEGAVAFSCIGRWLCADDKKTFRKQGGPCQYTGGGLFKLNPVAVTDAAGVVHMMFAFAEKGD